MTRLEDMQARILAELDTDTIAAVQEDLNQVFKTIEQKPENVERLLLAAANVYNKHNLELTESGTLRKKA